MKKVFIVEVEGWGESEDEFYTMGTYSTLAKAEAKVEKLLKHEWVFYCALRSGSCVWKCSVTGEYITVSNDDPLPWEIV